MANQSPRNNLRTVEEAIALRAIGPTWEEVARRLSLTFQTVRSYPRRYPEFWARRLAEAHQELDEEVLGEARAVLRFHMRSPQKDGLGCARVLLDHARRRLPLGAPAEAPPAHTSHYHQIAEHLEGLSDEERQALLDSESPEEPVWEGDEGLLPPTVVRRDISE
jgi:hypothetical protein